MRREVVSAQASRSASSRIATLLIVVVVVLVVRGGETIPADLAFGAG
ncbi:hypothetical protein Rhow_002960 [Rhodococcus wratislaviensis]|uniref:Uncharacterized protein n=1 Tax=Rhodococcus wratislaviensis TaxID=44752 RepID=A0A402C742_RHOWR|nr:hypothetical protein Rhow_002960 [Rhodococcus wratislaviensis]